MLNRHPARPPAPAGRLAAPLAALLMALLMAVLVTLVAGAGPAGADEVRARQRPVLAALGLEKAWSTTQGAGVTVAVLDSGVDGGHRDLAGSVIRGPDLAKRADPPGARPLRLHGTNMASLIAGHGHGPGRGDGVIGVAPRAKILSIRVILEQEEPGFGTFQRSRRFDSVVADGIRAAVDRGADVINLSLTTRRSTKGDRDALAYAVGKGVVVVAAAGNEAKAGAKRFTPFSYPASYPGVIAVAAVGSNHRRAGFSNRNAGVLVAAPGVGVVGAGPGNAYWIGSGTSHASALVSGVAALVRAEYPKLTPAQVVQAILAGVRHRPKAGYSVDIGFGEVNAPAALAAAGRLAAAAAPPRGHPPGERFAPVAEPVQVVRHDSELIARNTLVTAAGGAGALGSLVVFTVLAARSRRDRRRAVVRYPHPYAYSPYPVAPDHGPPPGGRMFSGDGG